MSKRGWNREVGGGGGPFSKTQTHTHKKNGPPAKNKRGKPSTLKDGIMKERAKERDLNYRRDSFYLCESMYIAFHKLCCLGRLKGGKEIYGIDS
jgi:hypothetical protein